MASSVGLLVTVGRGRLGALDVVQITAGGSSTCRASLFDSGGLVARSWRASLAPAAVVASSPRTLVRLLQRRS
jgi:hypothetical protein